jgi:hypothetical protein
VAFVLAFVGAGVLALALPEAGLLGKRHVEPEAGLRAGAHTRKLAKSPQPAAPPLVRAAAGNRQKKKSGHLTEINQETGGIKSIGASEAMPRKDFTPFRQG